MTQRLAPDLCVIGAGSGGLSVAAGAAQMGAEVVLIERGLMGGDCLNFGCVPSKSLLAAAARRPLAARRGAQDRRCPITDRFRRGRRQYSAGHRAIAPTFGRTVEGLGVRVLRAEARFTGPRTVRAGEVEIRPRRFVIATGSHPAVPAIPGLDGVPYLTNETIFSNRELPEHLSIIGGGPIGVEMAQAHCRLGARVTVIDVGPLLPRDDPELAASLVERLTDEGVVTRPRVEIARSSATARRRSSVSRTASNQGRICWSPPAPADHRGARSSRRRIAADHKGSP
jgi:pyruvate/2-oxoglutarate dehydrogenase complex dihydrolipoamide dehydrogenase (E3) component